MVDIAEFVSRTLPRYDTTPPDFASDFAEGMNLRQMMDERREAARKQGVQQKLQQLVQQYGGDLSSPELQQQAMGLDLGTGMAFRKAAHDDEESQLKLRESRHKVAVANQDQLLEMGHGLHTQWSQLPEDQRTPEALQAKWNSYADYVRQANPELADLMTSKPVTPEMAAMASNLYQQRLAAKMAEHGRGMGAGDSSSQMHGAQPIFHPESKTATAGWFDKAGNLHDTGQQLPPNYTWQATDQGYMPFGRYGDQPGGGAATGAASKPLMPAGTANQLQGRVSDLRKEFMGSKPVKDYMDLRPVMQSVRSAKDRNTKAADLNLVYAFAKAMDPGSVVRESEGKMVLDTAAPDERIKGWWSAVTGGSGLTPETRANLMTELESRYKGHQDTYNTLRDHYRGIAEANKYPLDQVMPNLDDTALESGGAAWNPQPPRPPQAGHKWMRNKVTGEFREVPIQ